MSTDKVPDWAKEALAATAEAKEKETECTCKEDSKQRALCPVCDKERFDRMKSLDAGELKKIHPAMLEGTFQQAIEFFNEAFRKRVMPTDSKTCALSPDKSVTITITKADHYTYGKYDMGGTRHEEADNPQNLW